MHTKKALITGGTGFIGSNLARRLVNDGWQVHLITRYNQPDDIKDHFNVHIHDGSTICMNAIMAEATPDVVFHLASLFLSEHSSNDIERLIISNVLFGAQLLDAMTTHKITKIVNTGTAWQHYQNKQYSPVNLYAATKQAFEDILQYYVETHNISATTLKLFDTYGPMDPRPKLFHLLNRVAKENKPLAMSPGEQLIDLVYIDDVVQAFVVAAERLQRGLVIEHETFGISSGNPIALKKLVETYGHVLGKQLPIEWGHKPYRNREVMVPWDSYDSLPGWNPNITLDKGIIKTQDFR